MIFNKLLIAKGHLDQERVNLQSTKMSEDENTDFCPIDGVAIKTRENITKLQPLKEKLTQTKQDAFPTGPCMATST